MRSQAADDQSQALSVVSFEPVTSTATTTTRAVKHKNAMRREATRATCAVKERLETGDVGLVRVLGVVLAEKALQQRAAGVVPEEEAVDADRGEQRLRRMKVQAVHRQRVAAQHAQHAVLVLLLIDRANVDGVILGHECDAARPE